MTSPQEYSKPVMGTPTRVVAQPEVQRELRALHSWLTFLKGQSRSLMQSVQDQSSSPQEQDEVRARLSRMVGMMNEYDPVVIWAKEQLGIK